MDRRPHPKKRVPLSGPMVREKAKYLYAHFKEPDGSCSVSVEHDGEGARRGIYSGGE
uniref:Uncharacterized protein n=1 Tax=Rhodnius prolixus TaxID=13249 RepID=T1HNV2_RHOPR